MSIKAKFELQVPKKAIGTMTISMEIEEWEELYKQLDKDKWPTCDFSYKVRDLIAKAKQSIWSED